MKHIPLDAGILIVDDEMPIRKLCESVVEQTGYSCFMAENGLQALRIFLKHKEQIVLVVTDVQMPEMAGDSLVKELRAINPNIKILVISGRSMPDSLNQDEQTFFLQKPFDLQELLEKIQLLLA